MEKQESVAQMDEPGVAKIKTDKKDKVSKVAKIRNRYNQVPHLTKDTNGKVTNSQKTPQTRAKSYLLVDYKPVLDKEYVSDKVKELLQETEDQGKTTKAGANEDEPPSKKMKIKGRNKRRPKDKRISESERMCPTIVREETCNFGDRCKYSHDRAKFMATKLPDISEHCYVFDTYGKCPFGLTCRFASSHLTEEFKNIITDKYDKAKFSNTVQNVLKKENQFQLWKRKYDFSKAEKVIDEMGWRNPKDKQRSNNKEKSKEKQADTGKTELNVENESKIAEKGDNHIKDDANCKLGADLTDAESAGGGVNRVGEEMKASPIQKCENVDSSCAQNGGSTDITVIYNEGDNHAKELNTNNTDSNLSRDSSNGQIAIGSNMPEPKSSKSDVQTINRNASSSTCNNEASSETLVGDDEGIIRLRPQEKKKVNFDDKLYLAPLTTVGNLPFRRICKKLGADITCGEMAVATNLLQGQASEWALLKRHQSEDVYGVQVCGAYPDTMTRCAQLINDIMEVDFVDINCGCPIDLIFKKGEGSALMGRVPKLEQIIKGMTSVLDVPLTVKMRTGIYTDKNTAHTLIPQLRDWNVALTTIHGRSRVQRYTKLADWDYINECAKLAGPMPVYGNGDILSFVDANQRREKTGVNGLMIARGALIKPWIFTEIKEQRHWDISANERFDILKDYANFGLEHWGSDQQGVTATRRFLLEWLSFLYRYIPVGVLERVPQKINERAPYYKGRNELETLMASPNCGDWIKISEMLLGPVPEGFSFLPKHKANAYK